MVKKGNFPKGMKWKEGSGKDLKPDSDIIRLDLENLELVKPSSLSVVKSAQLEQAGLWIRPTKPSQKEESGSMSRAGTGISLCVRLKRTQVIY